MSGPYHELTLALTRELSERAAAAPGDASALARAAVHERRTEALANLSRHLGPVGVDSPVVAGAMP
jgi:CRP-like cAMP-binding protein